MKKLWTFKMKPSIVQEGYVVATRRSTAWLLDPPIASTAPTTTTWHFLLSLQLQGSCWCSSCISALNLTVTQDMININGLIFYIAWTYQSILFPKEVESNLVLVFLKTFIYPGSILILEFKHAWSKDWMPFGRHGCRLSIFSHFISGALLELSLSVQDILSS